MPTEALSNRKAGTDHGSVIVYDHCHRNSGRIPVDKARKGRSGRRGSAKPSGKLISDSG